MLQYEVNIESILKMLLKNLNAVAKIFNLLTVFVVADDLIQSNIFDTVLEEKSSDTLQALNVNPTDASQNNINRLNEDKNINKPKLNASLNSNSSLHDHISSDEANISQTNTLTSSPEIVTTATTSSSLLCTYLIMM